MKNCHALMNLKDSNQFVIHCQMVSYENIHTSNNIYKLYVCVCNKSNYGKNIMIL